MRLDARTLFFGQNQKKVFRVSVSVCGCLDLQASSPLFLLPSQKKVFHIYIMDFFKNFNNYKPKDFKGKSVKEILELKPNKVPDNFFQNDYKLEYSKELAEAALTHEQLNAIQLLSDLRDKNIIYNKCYNKSGPRTHSVVPGHHSIKHPQMAQPVQAKVEEVKLQAEDERELVPEQTGGKRSRSKSKRIRSGSRSRSKRTRSSKKHKHSSKKRTSVAASKKRTRSRTKKYKGGGSPFGSGGISATGTGSAKLPIKI